MFYNYHEWSDDRIKEKYQEILDWVSERSAERASTTNCYTCEKCHRSEKYIYLDSGVTPFIMRCNFCGGDAQSSFGRDILHRIPASKEWFRPELEEILRLKNSDDEKDHYKLEHYLNGGLESRERFSGERIFILAGRGGRVSDSLRLIEHLGCLNTLIVAIDDHLQFPPIPELPKPVEIPKRNILPAPKNRQQRRKEERENRKKKRR